MTDPVKSKNIRVKNSDIGAERGHKAQSAAKARRDTAAWDAIFFLQLCNQTRRVTLQKMADELTLLPHTQTQSGEPWTQMQVSRVFATKGMTPKELFQRITMPDAFERKGWPQRIYDAWFAASQELDALNDRNGSWVPSVDHPAARTELVRFKSRKIFPGCDRVAQVVQERGGRYTLRILDFEQGGTWDTTAPVLATELETWVWVKSREERILESERLRKRYFHLEDKIFPGHR